MTSKEREREKGIYPWKEGASRTVYKHSLTHSLTYLSRAIELKSASVDKVQSSDQMTLLSLLLLWCLLPAVY